MNYDDAVRYLLSLGKELAAPQQAAAQKFDLRNIIALADRLDQPHRAAPCVHIAGTNGKGSTAAMLASILQQAGLRTGLYTSPHLVRINERIRIDGQEIPDADFAAAFNRIHAFIEAMMAGGTLPAHPTYFECITAMAFDYFAHQPVDFVVYEVGMGGRLDATNIVTPEVAVITQIDFDHENFLGHSIEQIAAEKAGIIKPGAWVVSSAERPEARAVIQRVCAERDALLVEVDTAYAVHDLRAADGRYHAAVSHAHSARRIELHIGLAGKFQVRNALAALAIARLLAERGFPLDDAAIARGIAEVRWPGRLELLCAYPAVYLDGAHNPAATRALLEFWQDHCAGRRIHLVYGALRDKAVDEIAGLLFPHAATVTLTQPRTARAISADVLADMTRHLAPRAEVLSDPEAALARALEHAAPDDVVFATGSLFLVGDLRAAWPRIAAKIHPVPERAS